MFYTGDPRGSAQDGGRLSECDKIKDADEMGKEVGRCEVGNWKKRKSFYVFAEKQSAPGCGKFGKEFEKCASEEHETPQSD